MADAVATNVGRTLAVLLTLGVTLCAQESGPVTRLSELSTQRGKTVSIQQVDGIESSGTLMAATDSELVLRVGSSESRIPAENIRLVWRQNRATEKGALGGMLIGGLLGAVLFAPDDGRNQGRAAAVSISGALIGAWIGHRHVARCVLFTARAQSPCPRYQ